MSNCSGKKVVASQYYKLFWQARYRVALTVADSRYQVGREIVQSVEVVRLEVVLVRRIARDCQQL